MNCDIQFNKITLLNGYSYNVYYFKNIEKSNINKKIIVNNLEIFSFSNLPNVVEIYYEDNKTTVLFLKKYLNNFYSYYEPFNNKGEEFNLIVKKNIILKDVNNSKIINNLNFIIRFSYIYLNNSLTFEI